MVTVQAILVALQDVLGTQDQHLALVVTQADAEAAVVETNQITTYSYISYAARQFLRNFVTTQNCPLYQHYVPL